MPIISQLPHGNVSSPFGAHIRFAEDYNEDNKEVINISLEDYDIVFTPEAEDTFAGEYVGYTPDINIPNHLTSTNVQDAITELNVANNTTIAQTNLLVTNHNVDVEAHNDLRRLIDGLTTRLDTFFDSTSNGGAIDQLVELVSYINSNKELIDAITTNKVNVSDIINDLTTNMANKPLSAAQGVILKGYIDAINNAGYITGYTETDPTVPAWAKRETKPTYTAVEVKADPEGSAKAVQEDLDTHKADDNIHITSAERISWNNKLAAETDPTVPAWAKEPTKPSYTPTEIGLGNVNNTADMDKPVSTATLEVLKNKQDKLNFDTTPTTGSKNPVTSGGVFAALELKQNNLTFDTTPTQSSSNPITSNAVYVALSDKATTKYVDDAVAALVNGAPEALRTLDALAAALGDDENFVTTILEEIGKKQDTLTFDQTPTLGSFNPVTSGGIYGALNGKQDKLTIDTTPTTGSANPVTSGAVYAALANKQDNLTFDTTATSGSSNAITSGAVFAGLNGKQNKLTFDSSPIANSSNPITSGAVYTALSGKQNALTFDSTPTQNSSNVVTSGVLYTALNNKQNKLTFDSTPASGSTNPITSGGVYAALSGKQNTLTFDSVPTAGSTNPVTSAGIKSYVDTAIQNAITAAINASY